MFFVRQKCASSKHDNYEYMWVHILQYIRNYCMKQLVGLWIKIGNVTADQKYHSRRLLNIMYMSLMSDIFMKYYVYIVIISLCILGIQNMYVLWYIRVLVVLWLIGCQNVLYCVTVILRLKFIEYHGSWICFNDSQMSVFSLIT